jgi:hypothetical protein
VAHFAETVLDNNNNLSVSRVLVVDNQDISDIDGNEVEAKGLELLQSLLGGDWVQTSYNSNFRKNYAGIGYTYDRLRDAFIPPKPYPSWILNEYTCLWDAPVPMPDDDNKYMWNEETSNWNLTEVE